MVTLVIQLLHILVVLRMELAEPVRRGTRFENGAEGR
jgi:hypothetical protein